MPPTRIPATLDLRAVRSKVADLPPEIQTAIAEKALASSSKEQMVSFERVLHRRHGDQALIPSKIHPEYPYMRVLKPLWYGFPEPLVATLQNAMAAHTVAIELDTQYLKQILGLNGPVPQEQVDACSNLFRFLECLLPQAEWKNHVREATAFIIVICSRKLHLKSDGVAEYQPRVFEVIPVAHSVYTKSTEYDELPPDLRQKLWSANNDYIAFRSEWNAAEGSAPWKKFPEAYEARTRLLFRQWYYALNFCSLRRMIRVSDVVRTWVRKARRSALVSGYIEFPTQPSRPRSILPCWDSDSDEDY